MTKISRSPSGLSTPVPVVRRVFRLVGEEGYSLRKTKLSLEADGIPTARGFTRWNVNTVRRLINLDAYKPFDFEEVARFVSPAVAARLDPQKKYGITWYNRKRAESEDEHIAVPIPEAGMPREVVEKARESLRGNTRPSRADDRFWPLSGCAYCACGRRFVCRLVRPRGKKYYYYVCPRHHEQHGSCEHGRWHPAEALETRVFWAVWQLVSDPESLRERVERFVDSERQALRNQDEAISNAGEVLENLTVRRDRYQEAFAAGAMTLDELKEKLRRLDENREAAEAELARLSDIQGRIEFLDYLKENAFSLEAIAYMRSQKDDDELLEDLYRELELKVTVRKDGSAKISGVFGLQNVTSTKTVTKRNKSGDLGHMRRTCSNTISLRTVRSNAAPRRLPPG